MSERRAVVLVPGLWMPAVTTAWLARRLRAAGYAPYPFGYRSVAADLATNAAALAAFLECSRLVDPHFVGHSLGGALVLTTLAHGLAASRGRVVCLGSPLAGSRAAEALASLPGRDLVLGRSLPVYQAERLERWEGPNEVGMIAGRVPFGVGRWLARFDGPNDGTVAVDETRLPGLTDHITLGVTHFSLLWSREVARETGYFLEHGCFAHERLASATSS